MTRVIHTGDTHIGYRQYHRPERREDFLDAFRQVAADAVADGADAVVHAGDLFHDRRPDLRDLLGTLSVLRELDDAGIPFLAVVGNHENKRDAQWLDLFSSLGLATRLGAEPVVVGDTAFYGLDFVPRSRRDDLEYAFDDHDADHAALVAHGLFAPLAPDFASDPWDVREVLAAADVDFDAVLLGDDHTPKRRQLDDGTWVTYCGSTERTSADEREERGYNVVGFDGDVTISRRGLPTREFVFVDVDLAEGEGLSRVQERVGQEDLDGAVAVVRIDGAGDPVAPAHVEEFVREQGALVARVTDRRETADGTDLEVSFADPDEAVRERVRGMGLSSAARDLDETIRASKVADSNVTDEVERRVRDLLDEAPEAFDAAPTAPDPSVGTETAADRMADDDSVDPTAGGDGGEPVEAAATGDAPADADPDRSDDASGADDTTDAADGESADDTTGASGPTAPDAGNGQASMEDYL